jgi:hypothetical protein
MMWAILESERSRLTADDRLFVLRRYKLNLDRELARASASIQAIEIMPEHAGAPEASQPRRRKE